MMKKSLVLAGWVSANQKLKNVIKTESDKRWFNFIYPTKNTYSQDNAAMVWILTYYKIKNFTVK